jgi:organic radical activating enzyme
MSKYQNPTPNFSIVLPGGCNAKCEFCFWTPGGTVQFSRYLGALDDVLHELPDAFQSISLTGGEPTLSPALVSALRLLEKYRSRFRRIVLTTNGHNLESFIPSFEGIVDFVNISRHSEDDAINREVFGTDTVPAVDSLAFRILELNRIGIPVTLSRILRDDDTAETIAAFLEFARDIHASQVFFRKPHGSLDPHPVESSFDNWKAIESSCPVCLDRHQVIRGLHVSWKRGLLEPSTVGFHELIMQPDARLTVDWLGKMPITMAKVNSMYAQESIPRVVTEYVDIGSVVGCGFTRPLSGCGSSSRYTYDSSGCGGGRSSGGHC